MKKIIMLMFTIGLLTHSSGNTLEDVIEFTNDVEAECRYLLLNEGVENIRGLAYMVGSIDSIISDRVTNKIPTKFYMYYTLPIKKACLHAFDDKDTHKVFSQKVTEGFSLILNN